MGDDDDTAGVGVMGSESGRYEVCDSTDAMGAGALGGRVWSSFRRKIFKEKIFFDKKYFFKK